SGRYLSPDPIGLAGGLHLYGYVPDPNGWMDPWGWVCDPVHHLATNKHSHWSPRFRKLFDDYGLGRFKNGRPRTDVLNDPLNKVRIPGHKGPHPDDSHQYIFDHLQKAAKSGSANGGGKTGGKAAIEAELEQLKLEATTPGTWLNKVLTKT
ncbi:RHS repeat-associated core domain-containing protein, partial [Chitinilyticum litopenaei]|uniref:RHS repeat-associated core domain-containing protein n=1 Tax=Chitinilyticum litopenaei TaxID=1121276 RepID=UPI001B7FB645